MPVYTLVEEEWPEKNGCLIKVEIENLTVDKMRNLAPEIRRFMEGLSIKEVT